MTVEAVQDGDAEVGGELGELVGPVGDQAGGDDDEGGAVEAAVFVFDGDVGDGLGGFAEAHVVGEEGAEAVFAQMLEPVDAVLLVGAEFGLEAGGDGDRGDGGAVAEAGGVGFDGAGVVPAGGQQVFEVEDAGGFGGGELDDVFAGAAGGVEQVGHDGEEAADAFGGEFEDAAVVERGEEFAVDDLGGFHAAAVEQAGEDGEQGDAGAVDLDAEIEREAAGRGVGDADVGFADGLDDAGAEFLVDLVLPAEDLECRDAAGDEGLPAFRGIAAAEDVGEAAAGGGAFGEAHLGEAVGGDHRQGRGFGGAVAADEGLGLEAALDGFGLDELTFVLGGGERAAVVEIDGEGVDALHLAHFVRAVDPAQAQDRDGGGLDEGGVGGAVADGSRALAAGEGAAFRGFGDRRRWGRGGGGLAEAGAADFAAGGIDVPGAGVAEDDGGLRGEFGGLVGREDAFLAGDEDGAGGFPAGAAEAAEEAQDIGDGAGRDGAGGDVAAAQHAGHDAAGFGVGAIGEDGFGGDRLFAAAAFADQDGGDGAGDGGGAGGEFEDQALTLGDGAFGRARGGEAVEGGFGGGFAERGEAVEGGEAAGGEVGAAGLAAAAFVEEDQAVAEGGGDDAGDVALAEMFDGDADGVRAEGDFDGAEQDQGAAAGEGFGVEDAGEVLGGELGKHGHRGEGTRWWDRRVWQIRGGLSRFMRGVRGCVGELLTKWNE
jgi:hypothetical protein